MFSCKFCEISNNTFTYKHLRATLLLRGVLFGLYIPQQTIILLKLLCQWICESGMTSEFIDKWLVITNVPKQQSEESFKIKRFLKILLNSQGQTHVLDSIFNPVDTRRWNDVVRLRGMKNLKRSATLFKSDSSTGVFLWILRNI